MAVDDIDLFTDDDIAEYREEGKDRRECCFSVDDEEWYMVDLEAIGEVTDTRPALVCVGDYDNFVSTIYKFLGNREKRLELADLV